MLSTMSNFLVDVLSVICCAAAVKLADDFLDKDRDACSGKRNWALPLGSGALFYAILGLILAAGLDSKLSLPLFLASYIVGMFNACQHIFPSRLTGMQECIVLFILGLCLFGAYRMLFSLGFIMAVQLFDDCLDICQDQLAGYRNWAYRFGVLECSLLAALCLAVAWYFGEEVFFPVFLGTVVFYGLIYYQEAKP